MLVNEVFSFYKNRWLALEKKTPSFHIVLGSGFGQALEEHLQDSHWQLLDTLPFVHLPGYASTTSPDHKGELCFLENPLSGQTLVVQKGRLHGYEGRDPLFVVLPVMLSRFLGVKNFVLTNAAGALTTEYKTGDVMLIQDHVNFTGRNPLVGLTELVQNAPSDFQWGTPFVDLTQAYQQDFGQSLVKQLQKQKLNVHQGVYLGVMGPSLETPAEVRLFAQWGLQAVGMSTVWENICLKYSGADVVGLSLISNLACGLVEGVHMEPEKILEVCRSSARQILSAILEFVQGESHE